MTMMVVMMAVMLAVVVNMVVVRKRGGKRKAVGESGGVFMCVDDGAPFAAVC